VWAGCIQIRGATFIVFQWLAGRGRRLGVPRRSDAHDEHLTFPLPAPPETDPDLLVPARMVNEWVCCPRLAYLEWVEGAWA